MVGASTQTTSAATWTRWYSLKRPGGQQNTVGSLETATGCVRNTIKDGCDCFDSDGASQSAATSPPSQSAPPAARGFANQKVTLLPHDHVTAFIVMFIPLVIDGVSVVALPLVPLVTLTPLATPATLVIFTACIHWPWFRSWWSTCMRSEAQRAACPPVVRRSKLGI